MNAPLPLSPDQARTRLHELTVIDVRTPAEFASGHLPGAVNIPLDQLTRALPAIREAADGSEILLVCASGGRSENACRTLAAHGVTTATLTGGTGAWADRGHTLHRPEEPRSRARSVWAMERQVRFTAGGIVLTGLALGLLHPAWQLLAAGVAGGLVYSALSDTCGMAVLLGKLPFNRSRSASLDAALDTLRQRRSRKPEPRQT